MGFIPEMQGFYNTHKSINVTHPVNKLKNKNHMIISTDTEKGFHKIEYQFMIKNSPECGNRNNTCQHNKVHI